MPSRLIAGGRDGRFRYDGTQARQEGYTIQTRAGGKRVYSKSQMLDWLDGFDFATEADAVRDTGPVDLAPLAEVRSVLVHPSLTDQCRVLIRVGMQRSGLGVVKLAERIGVTKKAVSEALHFGSPSTLAMLAAVGLEHRVRPDLEEMPHDAPVDITPRGGWLEPAPLLRMRLLAAAHELGVLRWSGPAKPDGTLDVNKGMHARTFEMSLGRQATEVHTDFVACWIAGVVDAVAPEFGDAFHRATLNPLLDVGTDADAGGMS